MTELNQNEFNEMVESGYIEFSESEFKKTKIKIFKSFKDLDIEIRTIENDQDEDKTIYYIVEVGLYESLGEHGEILTLLYDKYPSEKEIIQDTIKNIQETREDLNDSILSAKEEKYLKILNKLKSKGVI